MQRRSRPARGVRVSELEGMNDETVVVGRRALRRANAANADAVAPADEPVEATSAADESTVRVVRRKRRNARRVEDTELAMFTVPERSTPSADEITSMVYRPRAAPAAPSDPPV